MEQITSEEDHVYITFLCQTHDFMEGLPAVVAADGVSFVVADMTVGCDEDTDSVSS